MRTGSVKINGKEYITCFSTRVLLAIEEREGTVDGLDKILNGKKMSDLFWLLEQLIDAGDRYARMEEIENPGTLTYEQLVDLVGVDEYGDMFSAVTEAAQKGASPEVKVKTSKNGETAQAE